jgi:hypothetical protein
VEAAMRGGRVAGPEEGGWHVLLPVAEQVRGRLSGDCAAAL